MSRQPENRIKELREARGLSMQALADLCAPETSPSAINKLEKGHQELTVAWMRRLGDALGVDYLEILEPVPRLTEDEQAILDVYRRQRQVSKEEQDLVHLFRGLSENDKQAFYVVAESMAKPADTKKRHTS